RPGGCEALTYYEGQKRIISEFGKFTLLKAKIETGRTHQIRVHLASIGHPVVGDTLYGAPREIRAKSGAPISLQRNFLHSAELEFAHPGSGETLRFSSLLPEQLSEFLDLLEANPATEKRL